MNELDTIYSIEEKLGDRLPAPHPEYRFRCPMCIKKKGKEDKTGHMYVNLVKSRFICHRCSWKGPIKTLLENIGVIVETTVANWADMARNMSIFRDDVEEVDDSYDNTTEIDYPCPIVSPILIPRAWNYLTSPKSEGGRGLTADHIAFYRLSVGTGDKYQDRIFIPTLHDGYTVFWVARSITGKSPKYLNPKDVSKKYYIFGLEQAKSYDTVIITEGVFSAIAAGANAVATFGKAVSEEQKVMLLDAEFKNYYVALDGDARTEAVDLSKWLKDRGANVFLVDMPFNKDPDSDEHFHERLAAAKPFDFYSAALGGLSGFSC